MADYIWTQEQFEEMSWHDNHVHAIRVVEGSYGPGQLVLDLDYILEWINDKERFQFRLQPMMLTFFEVADLRISLDYATPTAALGPFSIHAIKRVMEQRERYIAQVWNILINWPKGEISFEAQGFEQRGYGASRLSDNQYLRPDERGTRLAPL